MAMAVALAQVVMKRCRCYCGMTHRDADLVEGHDDVSSGVDSGDAGPLLGIDHDAAVVAQRQAKSVRESAVTV